jgi:hypothetical protein
MTLSAIQASKVLIVVCERSIIYPLQVQFPNSSIVVSFLHVQQGLTFADCPLLLL